MSQILKGLEGKIRKQVLKETKPILEEMKKSYVILSDILAEIRKSNKLLEQMKDLL